MLRMEPLECMVCEGEHYTAACDTYEIAETRQEEREDIARDEPVMEYLHRVSEGDQK